MRPGSDARPLRLLVVAPNWLGDVVMTTPLLSWLAAARDAVGGPSVHITLAVRSAWAPLFVGDRRCDALLLTERPGRHAGWAGLWRQAAQWRAGAYGAVLLGPPSLRAAAVAWLAGIPCRVGHRGDARDALLTRPVRRAARGTRHYSRELLDLGHALAAARGWPEAAQPPLAAAGAPRLFATAPADVAGSGAAPGGGRPWWALGMGTTYGPAKNWPAGPAAAFVTAAARRHGARVALLGDAAAAPLATALRAATPELAWSTPVAAGADGARNGATPGGPAAVPEGIDVLDLTGRTDLPGVVAWLRACAVYVGGDSGLMHVAAALGRPTVGLFGSSNPDWTGPAGPCAAAVAAEGFACRPCYRRTCDQPRFCLEDVSGDQVLAAVRGVLAAAAGETPAPAEGGDPR